MRQQATPANTNDSAAPRPTSAATPGPENDMARAGDMAPTDRPTASHTCRLRFSPWLVTWPDAAGTSGPGPAWSLRVSLIGGLLSAAVRQPQKVNRRSQEFSPGACEIRYV